MELDLAISPPELHLQATMCSRNCGSRAFARGLCRTCYEDQRPKA